MLKRIFLFLSVIFLFVAALTVSRFIFLFLYFDFFADVALSSIISAFFTGIRFDLSAAATLLAPFILLLFIPGVFNNRYIFKPLLYTILLWQVFLISYNFIDILYFEFSQRHLTFELGNTAGELDVIFHIAVKEYAVEALLLLFFIGVYVFAFANLLNGYLNKPDKRIPLPADKDYLSAPVSLLLVVVMSVVFVRGGFQFKPLGVKDAFKSSQVELGLLSLNGLYTTFATIYKVYKGEKEFEFLADFEVTPKEEEEFFISQVGYPKEKTSKGYPLYRNFNYKPSSMRKMNVVVMVMESWSGKFSKLLGGKVDAMPNFDRLSKDGFLATNGFANAQRSIEGLSAILGSMPVWKGMILGQGELLYQTRLKPMGATFKELGYETFFIHGARPGSMGFDGLVKRLGFNRHISRDDFELTPENHDDTWGIYDEYAFHRANDEFKKMDKPFFAVIFSLTSHSPYTFPETDFKKFDKSTKHSEFLNSLKYSDWALGQFFEKASSEKYFKNTLFVIVGDHTEGASTNESLYESYHVPLLFYAPGAVRAGQTSKPVSQIDIFPSIMDKLKVSAPYTSWGRSVFSKAGNDFVLPRGDLFVYQSKGKLLLTDSEKVLGLYSTTGDKTRNLAESNSDEAEKLLRKVKIYIKLTTNLIEENRVSP